MAVEKCAENMTTCTIARTQSLGKQIPGKKFTTLFIKYSLSRQIYSNTSISLNPVELNTSFNEKYAKALESRAKRLQHH